MAKEKLKLDNLPSVEQAAAAGNVLLVLQLDPEFEHYFISFSPRSLEDPPT